MIRQFTVIPRVVWLGARSWLGYFGTRPPEKEGMWADRWGWTGPGMAEHWDRYFAAPRDVEAVKNLGSEWARLDAQRAYKVAALLLCVSLALVPVAFLVGGVVGFFGARFFAS